MNPELLTCRRLTAGLLYAPVQVQMSDLNRLYAVITERYPYQTLQHLPDGIRMANPENDCFVQQTRTQVNEEVMYFQATKEKCLDIFNTVQEHLHIPQFMTFGVKLTAFMPVDEPGGATELIESRLLAVKPSQWSLLGEGRRGTGLRIVLQREGTHELRIEPFFGDTSQLYVELDVQYPEPFTGLELVEARMDAAYEFMFRSVKGFLASV